MNRTANNKSTRWLAKSSPSVKSRRAGCEEGSIDPSVAANGIPDWENPMARSTDSSTVVTHSPPKGSASYVKSPVRRGVERHRSSESSRHTALMSKSHSTLSYSPTKSTLPKVPEPRGFERSRGIERTKSHGEKARQIPCVPANVFDGVEEEGGLNFVNMVIECDRSTSSNGELTVDESVMLDNYGRNQRSFSRNTKGGNMDQPCTRNQRNYSVGANTTAMRQTPSSHVIPDDNQRRSEPLSPRSLEDEEQRLIELAMERSLQEVSSQTGSAMSISRKSGASEFSHQSRSSQSYHRSNNAAVNLGGAGCHLSMMSSRVNSSRNLSQAPPNAIAGNNGPPGDAGPNFIWKREGKKWLKIPVDHSNLDGLQVIEEDINESMHASSLKLADEERLEQMERRMIEEAMQLSMKNSRRPSKHNYEDSFANCTNDILEMSEGDGNSQGSGDIDEQMALDRLKELEQEKALLEKVVRRRTKSDGGRQTRPNTLTSGNYSASSRRSFDRSVSDMSGAGCHLAMAGQSTDASNYEYRRTTSRLSLGSRDEQPSSNAGMDAEGRKLVWKRGPNNAWGRFPEDDGIQPNNTDDEDRLVAEALKRSLEEM